MTGKRFSGRTGVTVTGFSGRNHPGNYRGKKIRFHKTPTGGFYVLCLPVFFVPVHPGDV
jgi:hypothetical protein